MASEGDRAPPQGGILEGGNPTHYDPEHPITTFIIQAGIIIIFTRALHYPLALIRQPRVIAEVIGGILLGPSVLGRIPNFTDTIFPAASMSNLALIANLGLVLFLFLVGLEVDLRYLASNWKPALSVGAAGMILPFGLGAAIAWGLFHEFRTESDTEPISFGVYALFIGVAMAITAFPVLCRILTELKLLSTPVGIIVLSAGVGNDVVGWVLLALCVALVNAGSGLTALWVLLTCVAFVLFLVYAVRPAFMWVLRRNRALEDGPSQAIVALTLLIALASAFFTAIIGVHPIFGAFLAGVICPHEGGFAISVTEKVEDLVSALFLPLYFALSGLSTDIGLLNTGMTWAYVVGVIAIAFIAKFVGGSLAAKLNGMEWRESFAIGTLMSCKGLVELIVLNIGLQAEILNSRTFTIFVVMALVTTFATTPLTAAVYPEWYQKKLAAWKRGEIEWDTGEPMENNSAFAGADQKISRNRFDHLMVYLRLDNMPTLLALISLLGKKDMAEKAVCHPTLPSTDRVNETEPEQAPRSQPAHVHGIRLLELTQRPSTVMKVTEVDEYSALDPVLNAFKVLGNLYNLTVSGEIAIAPETAYADVLTSKAVDESADLLLLPWSETGGMGESQAVSVPVPNHVINNDPYTAFVTTAMDTGKSNVGVFVNIGFSGTMKRHGPTLERTVTGLSARGAGKRKTATPNLNRSHHVFAPFFGGPDDKLALNFVLQLAQNTNVTVTIMHFKLDSAQDTASVSESSQAVVAAKQDRFRQGIMTTAEEDAAFFDAMQSSLPQHMQSRVIFETLNVPVPLDAALHRAALEVGQTPKNGGDLIVIGRNAETAGQSDRVETCLGVAAKKFLSMGLQASLLVMQARDS
ncbi:hypothetical protein MBLNU230_g7918t1 [Neophaeotheca triangularis]